MPESQSIPAAPSPTAASRWLRTQPGCGGQPRLRVFCFPPAGGGSASFEPLCRAAGPETECLTVELPGHMTRLREPAVLNPAELSADIADVIAAAVAARDLPYVLLGQCMGAILAYEVAGLLEGHAVRPPAKVIVAGSNAPQEGPLLADDPVAFLRAMGSPEELFEMPALLDMTVTILRNDLAAMRCYECNGRVLDAPIMVLYGREDSSTDRNRLSGWHALSRGGVSVEELPGGHVFLDGYYATLLQRLHQELGGG